MIDTNECLERINIFPLKGNGCLLSIVVTALIRRTKFPSSYFFFNFLCFLLFLLVDRSLRGHHRDTQRVANKDPK
jgi:hypothetical protein